MAATIGITAVLHTWGSALTHHPHVHLRGLSLDGARWVASRSNFLGHVNAAEVATDAEQDRLVMSRTSSKRCGFPVPMRGDFGNVASQSSCSLTGATRADRHYKPPNECT